MTIGELAEEAGVTPRTIRYYVEQGLLPAPESGRPAEYGDEHVRRLALIRRLKDQYLPLEEIRDMLERLSLDELEALVRQPLPRTAPRGPLSSAADYITTVLGRGALREQLKQTAPAPPAPPPSYAPAPRTAPGALPPAAAAPGTPPSRPPAMAPPPAAVPAQAAAPEAAPSTWQRVPLAPGVELHYITPGTPRQRHFVARLRDAASRIWDALPEKDVEES